MSKVKIIQTVKLTLVYVLHLHFVTYQVINLKHLVMKKLTVHLMKINHIKNVLILQNVLWMNIKIMNHVKKLILVRKIFPYVLQFVIDLKIKIL